VAINVYKFRDIVEMELFLRGGIIGAPVGKGIEGLVGQTLTFTTPVGSHTFVTASRPNDVLYLTDIKSQLEAALGAGNIQVMNVGGQIAFVHPTSASAIAIAATSQPAKALLGFAQDKAVAGKLFGVVPATPPAFVTAYPSSDNAHVVVTNE